MCDEVGHPEGISVRDRWAEAFRHKQGVVDEIEGLPAIEQDDSHSSPRPVGGLQPGM